MTLGCVSCTAPEQYSLFTSAGTLQPLSIPTAAFFMLPSNRSHGLFGSRLAKGPLRARGSLPLHQGVHLRLVLQERLLASGIGPLSLSYCLSWMP